MENNCTLGCIIDLFFKKHSIWWDSRFAYKILAIKMKFTLFVFLLLLGIVFGKTRLVLQLTDIHIEKDYLEGAPALCEQFPCCRIDSVPKNETRPAPRYGDHNCDCAPEFFRDSLIWFKNYFDVNSSLNPDYILVTGDQATHRPKATQTADLNIELVRYAFTQIKNVFGDYPIIPAFGNHDTFPEGHMLPPPDNRWMTEVMADLWQSWLPSEQMENVLYGGYYTMIVIFMYDL